VRVSAGGAWFWEHFHVSKHLADVHCNAACFQALSSERGGFSHCRL